MEAPDRRATSCGRVRLAAGPNRHGCRGCHRDLGFSSGFEFWIGAQFRQPGPALQTEPADQSLHIGLRFADGRKVANVGWVPDPAGSVSGNLILSPVSFGGGMLQRSRSYWVWPLPPAGAMTFVCEWAAFGIPETSKDVDTQPILRAAAQSIKLWPEDKGSSPPRELC